MARNTFRRWSAADLAYVHAAAKAGDPVAEVADHLGRGASAVRHAAARLRVRFRHLGKRDELERARLLDWLSDHPGAPITAYARHVGRNPSGPIQMARRLEREGMLERTPGTSVWRKYRVTAKWVMSGDVSELPGCSLCGGELPHAECALCPACRKKRRATYHARKQRADKCRGCGKPPKDGRVRCAACLAKDCRRKSRKYCRAA